MLALFILTVLSCSINLAWTQTPFKDCGSESGTIQAFSVTGCTAAPCKLVKGNTYSMNLTFAAKSGASKPTVAIHGVIGGIPIPFPLPDPDACKLNVKCPVAQGDTDIGQLSLAVLSSYPSISLYVKIEIQDDSKQDFACLEFPATIISSAAEDRKLVGWKKGKLFEKLH